MIDAGIETERLAHLDRVLHTYVDKALIPGVQTLIWRHDRLVHHDCHGFVDVEARTEVAENTLYRLYSMTKPITSVALMMLYEQGHFLLENPVSRWIPEFAHTEVWAGGTADAPETRPLDEPLTIHHVLTHTSGLTYGFQYNHPVDELYRRARLGDFYAKADYDLDGCMERLAAQPLQFAPGTSWNYSMSTDVCGALVERMSGMKLDAFCAQHIFEPLGMTDTGFVAPEADVERCSPLYVFAPGKGMNRLASPRSMTRPPVMLSGGGGLVGTGSDYLRFCRMLLGGGQLDGVRVLSPRTVAFMMTNHLPGGATMNEMGQATFAETAMAGTGFGLGFSVLESPAENGALGSPGLAGWGGAASTIFWVDPHEDLAVVFMTQLLPSNTYPLRRHLQAGVYQALVD
ncbi:MAG: beta-lactamase family protein [Actinobacteria bacterium]|nr:beta-lactamase family protein [Actinomycetota bacterium]